MMIRVGFQRTVLVPAKACVSCYMVVSQNRGTPNIDPQSTIVLIIGTPKKEPLILGNLHIWYSNESMSYDVALSPRA